MTVYFHAGNPKSYSTFLQSLWTQQAKGPHFIYSGFRPTSDYLHWYRSDIEAQLLNNAWRIDSDIKFNQQLEDYQQWFKQLISQGNNANILISNENINMQVVPHELSLSNKIQRINAVINKPIEFILVYRNIKKAIYSLYKELVQMGLGDDFSSYLNQLHTGELNIMLPSLVAELSLPKWYSAIDEQHSLNVYVTDDKPPQQLLNLAATNMDVKQSTSVQRKGLSIELSEHIAKLNQQHFGSDSRVNLLEPHRHQWHLITGGDCQIWQKRRAIKQHSEQVLTSITNELKNDSSYDGIFYASSLYQYLVQIKQNDAAVKAPDNVKVVGDKNLLWLGID